MSMKSHVTCNTKHETQEKLLVLYVTCFMLYDVRLSLS